MSLPGIFLKKNHTALVNRESLSKKTEPLKTLLEKISLRAFLHSQDNFGPSSCFPQRFFTVRSLLTKKFEPNQILNKEAIFFLLLFKTAYYLKINNLPIEIKLTETLKAKFPTTFLAPEYLNEFLLFFNAQISCTRFLANFSIIHSIETFISNALEAIIQKIEKNYRGIASIEEQAHIALEFFKDKFQLKERDFDRIKEIIVNQHPFKR